MSSVVMTGRLMKRFVMLIEQVRSSLCSPSAAAASPHLPRRRATAGGIVRRADQHFGAGSETRLAVGDDTRAVGESARDDRYAADRALDRHRPLLRRITV